MKLEFQMKLLSWRKCSQKYNRTSIRDRMENGKHGKFITIFFSVLGRSGLSREQRL